ncbi:MAG: M28 family metallopeptidase [Gammaproteobacteria bacterium]
MSDRPCFPVFCFAALLAPLLAACSPQEPAATAADAAPQASPRADISAEDFARHVRTLASDEFEGREPSSPGGEKTVEYIRDEFAKLGLKPAAAEGYFQDVPLVRITADPAAELVIGGGAGSLTFGYGEDMIVWTKRVTEQAAIEDSELVFVGYGIVAPEYDWNDYEGLDMRGKTAVILVNDPGYATQDPELFTGNAMTYYGRWTYKFEEAARQGAAGALIVHETDAAGYPWEVVTGSWSGPQFDLESKDGNRSRVAIEGWITGDAAERLFAAAGSDYQSARKSAAERGFEAQAVGGLTATVGVENSIAHSKSRNVAGILPGSERPGETIIYMAHWDHLGRDESREGDQIFNGAQDNATGVAAIMEIAEAFAGAPEPPERSVLFLAVTAEESGLLGSAWYARNPLVPLAETVAAINIDRMSVLGPSKDVSVIGYGSSELEDWLARVAAEQGRHLEPEPTPEKGFFYRSDHFNLAKRGVPVLYVRGGIDHVERGSEWGRQQQAGYVAERYHKPADEFDPEWDLTGTVEDVEMLFTVGRELAASEAFPNWHEGEEFRAARDESRAGATGS